MRLDVSTQSVAGIADDLRRAAAALAAVPLPGSPPVDDLAARDAIGALLAVAGEEFIRTNADSLTATQCFITGYGATSDWR